MLFTGSDDKTIVIWDMINMYMVGKLEGHQDSNSYILILLLFSYLRFDCFARNRPSSFMFLW